MRYLILFALAYFLIKTVRNLLSKVKIVPRDSVNPETDLSEPPSRIKVDESNIEDADFKEVE
ncbi:MAG: hypothetical protein K9M55_10865 [Candidatus Marinimicrobia bacterium]|nr:hypothetical protein [Candidatus Neomarinimicrobiota bacterium]